MSQYKFLSGQSSSFKTEPELAGRLDKLLAEFQSSWKIEPEIAVRSPGRAEILGNHTDYNQGYALACAVTRSILALMCRRPDNKIRIRSLSYPGSDVTFDLQNISKDGAHPWSNYVRGVAAELQNAGISFGGADIMLEANLPSSGGISSSAAFELATAVGLTSLYKTPVSLLELALICKRAENGPLVGTPCGLLDQAAVALSENGKMVFLDFRPTDSRPVIADLVPGALSGYSFVILVDPEVKRNLGETGYPARRRMCEESVPVISALLGKPMTSLRDVSVTEFEKVRDALSARSGDLVRMRVEHVVRENQRVLDGVRALAASDSAAFGRIMNEAGHSALELYGLDEKTPELTHLVSTSREIDGVLGSRNMGGGFSAITLSLVKSAAVENFKGVLGKEYQKRWGRTLDFVAFTAAQGVEVL